MTRRDFLARREAELADLRAEFVRDYRQVIGLRDFATIGQPLPAGREPALKHLVMDPANLEVIKGWSVVFTEAMRQMHDFMVVLTESYPAQPEHRSIAR